MHFRQAITTKYIGPSNVRGSRVKAIAAAKTIILHWNSALNPDENHTNAAETLASKLEWRGKWYGGVTARGEYVFVNCDEQMEMTPAFEIEG